MGIVHNLSALAMRPMLASSDGHDGAPSAELLSKLNEHGDRVAPILGRANECAWQALEMALAGDSFWERVKSFLRRNADQDCRQRIRIFLDLVPLEQLAQEMRQQCLIELRTARGEGLLALGECDLSELAHQAWAYAVPVDAQTQREAEVLQRLADELREANLAGLAHLLTNWPGDHSHLLVAAYRFFLRRLVEEDAELYAALPVVAAESLEQEAGLTALAEAMATAGPLLDKLLEEVESISDVDQSELNIKAELPKHEPGVQDLGQDVVRLLEFLGIRRRHLQAHDCLSIDEDAQQRYLRELIDRFRSLADETRGQLPALLHGIAFLEALLGDYEDAEHDFRQVAALVQDIEDQAVAHFNAYVVALERREYQEALNQLQQAIARAPGQFAPFPTARYEVERILGAGGFGVTFLCRQRQTSDRVVLKALRPDVLDRDVTDVFRELQQLGEVDHPALLKRVDCDYVRGDRQRPYLVFEYFEGQTLAEFVEQHGHLSPADVRALVRPLAEGLLAVHACGIFQRNLTPTNVLVRRGQAGWEIKLIDLGLALNPLTIHGVLPRPAPRAHTRLGASVVTMLEYAAPEQLGWVDGVATGPYSDVYSFGKFCYFALLRTPDPDDEERESLPEGWRKLLGHCTARALARRLTNFSAVLERLAQLPAETATDPAASESGLKRIAPPATTASSPEFNPIQALLQRGQERLAKGDLAPALSDFNRVLELDPKSAPALCARGDLFRLKGDFDKAIADLTESLRIDNKFVQAYINRGRAFRLKGEYDKAITDFSRALKVDAKSADAYNNRGNAYADKGDYDKALADYTEAIKHEPNLALAYINRGLAHAKKGNYAAVIADCNEALKHNSKLVTAYFIRGAAHSSKGEYDKAIADFTRVLRLDPKYALAYNDRGLALAAKGEYDRAIADYNQALRFDSKLALAYMNRAITYRLKGDHERSITELTKLLRVYPKNASAYTNRGLAYFAKHDYDKAIADFTEALWIDPNHAEAYSRRVEAFRAKNDKAKAEEEKKAKETAAREERERRMSRATAHFTRAQMHFDNGHFDRAIADYGEAIKFDPDDAFTFYHRGLAYAANDEVDKALADYSEALRIDPKLANAYYHRGVSFRLKGNYARAVADFTETIRLDAKYALAYRNRGLAYAALGEQAKAKDDYEEAVRLDPALGKK